MRIHGQNSSSAGFGGHKQDSERSERFRRGHRVGQKVQGRIVEWENQELAWVEIDGQRLLAQVNHDSALGLTRQFLVLKLSPEIVLKEITGRAKGLNVVV